MRPFPQPVHSCRKGPQEKGVLTPEGRFSELEAKKPGLFHSLFSTGSKTMIASQSATVFAKHLEG
jgi:hypothetical protein